MDILDDPDNTVLARKPESWALSFRWRDFKYKCDGLHIAITAKILRIVSSFESLDGVFASQREYSDKCGQNQSIKMKVWTEDGILFPNNSLKKAITQICETYPRHVAMDQLFDVVIKIYTSDLQIPDSFCNLLGLHSLYIQGYSGVLRLPVQMSKLPKFRALTLTSDKSQEEFPVEIFEFTQLAFLSLAGSPQSRTVSSKLGNLVNLTTLTLELALEHLPEGIRHLKLLTHLYLRNNRLEDLPSWIGELKLLQTLSLRENRLYELPAEICQCESLKVINVRDNRLRSLPYRMGDLKKLQLIDLGYNVQLGRLPITLGRVLSKDGYHPEVTIIETLVNQKRSRWIHELLYIKEMLVDISGHLRMTGSLEVAILCGLADWKTADSPWSRFLCRGLYDPRLFLHVAAWADLPEYLDCFDTSDNDELARKRKLEQSETTEVVILE